MDLDVFILCIYIFNLVKTVSTSNWIAIMEKYLLF